MPKLDERDLYAEAGQLLRHYLSWREKLLAGYVAIVAALALGVVKYDGFLKIVRPGLAAVGILPEEQFVGVTFGTVTGVQGAVAHGDDRRRAT